MSFTSEASSPFVSKGRRNVSIKQCPYTSHRDEVYNDPALLPFAAMSPHQHLSLLPAQYSGDFHHPQAIVVSQLQYQPPHRVSNSPPTSEDATACVYSCRFSPFIALDRISLHLQFGTLLRSVYFGILHWRINKFKVKGSRKLIRNQT